PIKYSRDQFGGNGPQARSMRASSSFRRPNWGDVAKASTPTRMKYWRSWWASLRYDRVVAHNLIVGSGTIVAGALGVGFQSLVSHRLQPADFGAVFAEIRVIGSPL